MLNPALSVRIHQDLGAGVEAHSRKSARIVSCHPGVGAAAASADSAEYPAAAGHCTNLAETAPVSDAYKRDYDVFISHAAEDKDAVVRPLAHALRERGLSVWYDEFELRIGDSLRRKIDAGISRSRFGIIVLSASFFAKGWPQYE